MTVIDRNVIDFAYKDNDGIVLCISDHIEWDYEVLTAHWEILQDKLQDYMGYILGGQFKEEYGELKPKILIYFSYQWPDVVEKYLNKLVEIYKQYGCSLSWKYDPQDSN